MTMMNWDKRTVKTAADQEVYEARKEAMGNRKARLGQMRRIYRSVLLAVCLAVSSWLLLPQRAEANFNNYKGAECISCHVYDATPSHDSQ